MLVSSSFFAALSQVILVPGVEPRTAGMVRLSIVTVINFSEKGPGMRKTSSQCGSHSAPPPSSAAAAAA